MISLELFKKQEANFKNNIIPNDVRRVVVEAGTSFGWAGIIENENDVVSIDRFGESGPGQQVADDLGLSVDNLVKKISL